MPPFPRAELEEMIRRFVATNDECGRTGNWEPLARFYASDAIYSWNNGPKYEFVARGRDEIRKHVMGTEMEGLDKWTYPYVRTLIDDQKGEIIGIWRQLAPVTGDDGKPVEIGGTGGSWFRRDGGADIRPGDSIVVPLDVDQPLARWTAITQIVYNLAVAAAAVSSF